MDSVRRVGALLLLTLSLVWGVPTTAAAAQSGTVAQPQEPNRTPDFLFGRPKASIGLRGMWVFASAGSDLFDFVTRQLTIDRSDFNSAGISFDAGVAITSRLEAQFGFEWSKSAIASEYRDLVDNNFLPIEQTTALKAMHLTGGVRYALTPRGDEVSKFAWVPRRVVPFVGAGAGVAYYDFHQTGDFVDFVDLSVFRDAFRANGWTPSVHALVGVDMKLYRALYGTFEGRYTKAAGKLGADFIDFDPIDLSGFRVSAGINVLF